MARVLGWPVEKDAAGRLRTVEAGGDAHARQAVAILATTIVGDRIVKPTFGVPDPAGDRSYDATELQAAASRWLPFVEIVSVNDDFDPADPSTLDVTVTVRKD